MIAAIVSAGVVFVLLLLLLILRPKDKGAPYSPYFQAIRNAIGVGSQPRAFVDLDVFALNAKQVLSDSAGKDLRLVSKSFSSIALLQKAMELGKTNKILLFGTEIASLLLTRLGSGFQGLYGHPIATSAIEQIISTQPQAAAQIIFLVDSTIQLGELIVLAEKYNTPLQIALDIDVGLHRGGFDEVGDIEKAADMIATNPTFLLFRGFLGYEGQVTVVPTTFLQELVFKSAMSTFKEKVDVFFARQASLKVPGLLMSAGGSISAYMFNKFGIDYVNEISVGSAFTLPSNFDALASRGYQSALFFSSPVIRMRRGKIPFLESLTYVLSWYNVNWKNMFCSMDGKIYNNPISPAGLSYYPLMDASDGFSGRQKLVASSDSTHLQLGDSVFFRAEEAGLVAFYPELTCVSTPSGSSVPVLGDVLSVDQRTN